jgi:hypothetical protein
LIPLNKKFKKPYIHTIKVIHEYDQDPDLSYLQQDYYNDNPKYPLCSKEDNEKYKQQDKERLEDYYKNYWWMIGIYAQTEILIPYANNIFQTIPIRSPSIWGVESDAKDIQKDYDDEKIMELKELLKKLHVRIPKGVEIIRDE